jgi:hypothetical protein
VRGGSNSLTAQEVPVKRFRGLLALAVVCVAVPAMAADPTGTWKWSVERNGQTIETTLKLKLVDGKLTGTISGRNNTETEITDGKVEGDDVSFKVTREFNGNKFVQTYTGKLSEDAIKGKIEFERDGQIQSRDWEAKKG